MTNSLVTEIGSNPGLSIFQTLLDSYHPRDFDGHFWDGSIWNAEQADPTFTIVLNHPRALEFMLSPPFEVFLGESYAAGDYEIEGDFEAAFRLADHLIAEAPKLRTHLKLGLDLARLRFGAHGRSHSLSRIPFFKLSIDSRKHSESRPTCHHISLRPIE